MKVLFVCSGNGAFNEISPFIKVQGDSLEAQQIDLTYYYIKGKGIRNYLRNVPALKKFIKSGDFDIIHAHYALCGWVALLTRSGKPLILSLMGSDVFGDINQQGKRTFKSNFYVLLTKMIQPFVDVIIVKSAGMQAKVTKRRHVFEIPNGIRMDHFKPLKVDVREYLGLDPDKQYVLFLGNPNDTNKNIRLVQEAVKLLNRPDVELINIYKVPHEVVVNYLNAVDVFTLCSFSEGSPNVVKEAMSCNCPMVVVPAGDAAWVVGNTPGCEVAGYQPDDFSEKLKSALNFARQSGRTQGRERIYELGLDEENVARRLVSIYQKWTQKRPARSKVRRNEPVSLS
ncbi:MAG: glycosyltransferase family 4 protein [Saprospiraceae bacterium]